MQTMKNTYWILIILLFIGCKQGSEDPLKSKKAKEPGFIDLVSGYYDDPKNIDEQQQNEIIEYALDNDLPLKRTLLGVYYMRTEEGQGPFLQNGESVAIHYIGYFLDGREFDSSYKRNQPIKFQIGQMIPGWNDALLNFRSGSKGIIIVPSRMGYGEKGNPSGVVPPNTIIAFDIDVIY